MSALTTATMVILSTLLVSGLVLLTVLGRAQLNTDETYVKGIVNDSLIDPKGPEVQFILFTRWYQPSNMKMNNTKSLETYGFNLSNPTKIIIHGFISNINEDVFILNRDAYLATGDYNVIGMDWSTLCDFDYISALRGVRIAGRQLANFIDWITTEGVVHNDIHLVGHSLGCHVAAMAAIRVKGGKVGRISGLDPAGPGYNDVPSNLRLDASDATLVDIIHTNIQLVAVARPHGHIDFYPNGGRYQPGCPDLYDIWRMVESMECNHARAYWYFAESIRNKQAFRSYRCRTLDDALLGRCNESSNVYMGQVETYQEGLYYLTTHGTPPFSF